MAAYEATLAPLYPGHTIRTALLYMRPEPALLWLGG
jgi:hypothetical protein